MANRREMFAPAFVFTPRLHQEGARVTVECQVRANPTPVARWYLNDVDLAQSPHTAYLTCHPLDDNCFLLRMLIDHVSKEKSGLYRVTARNTVGEVTACINLDFKSTLSKST
ncbi:hypothetical protein RvY_00243 [Ramazzottius varieornatus]|uniref:Ig-like domain-containing protein n=1 Tax=Ramazzottius varieornatus TaxID=947166 RepID=A0A1D1UC27_RAMVA|nr:hypothetical protein RvY_00243 [Ramazzottius varieornatus]